MRKDWKYILYLFVAFGMFATVKMLSPKQHDWTVTYSHRDTNPYGAFALNRLLPSVFPGKQIHHSFKTLFEIKDSLRRDTNILIIASNFNGGKEDCDALLDFADRGGSIFISAEYFRGHFADTMNVETYDYFFNGADILSRKDSAALKFANVTMDTTSEFRYRRDNINNYFSRFDSIRTRIVAKNDLNQPVTIRIPWGKGNVILNSTPLIFTNICLLSGSNQEFLSGMLSYLPIGPLIWTEYYHVGRMEAGTPLRFILTTEPLRWAYYITVFSIILFVIFEMKRKQRIIPVIKPLENTTMEFVQTVGTLYYQSLPHKNIAEKKIHFLMDEIRSKYWINTGKLDMTFVRLLAGKTGREEGEIQNLVNIILNIQSKEKISEADLIELNTKIENFNNV